MRRVFTFPHGAARGVCLLALCAALALITACGGSKHKNNAPPTVQISSGPVITNNSGGAGGSSRGGSPFSATPPTPAPTCGPTDVLLLVDKNHALPPDYVPPDLVTVKTLDASPAAPSTVQLRKEAADALSKMLADARSQGIYLLAQSGYRSYDYQAKVYNAEVQNYGQSQADRESAHPGHSEHQTGLAMDFTTKALGYDLNESFAATPEGKWLAQSAVKYGFVLSYPQGQEGITGYLYEPWHYRYIGVAAAQKFAASGLALNKWLETRQVGCQP